MREETNKIRKKAPLVGFILLGLTAAGYMLPRAARTQIVLSRGSDFANILNWLYVPLAVCSLLVLGFAYVPRVRQFMQDRAEKILAKKQTITISHKRDLLPHDVRALLEKCKNRHLSLADLLDSCIQQIADAKEEQGDLAELIRLNNAEFLADTTSTLAKAEQMILRNLMAVINRGIVVKTSGAIDTKDEQDFEDLVKRVLGANNQVLETNRKFLVHTSDVISSKGVAAAKTTDTEEWIRVMQNQILASDLFKQDEEEF